MNRQHIPPMDPQGLAILGLQRLIALIAIRCRRIILPATQHLVAGVCRRLATIIRQRSITIVCHRSAPTGSPLVVSYVGCHQNVTIAVSMNGSRRLTEISVEHRHIALLPLTQKTLHE